MKLVSHPQIKIIWTILQNHFNIPDEIMIKILYTFKGSQHPVIPILFSPYRQTNPIKSSVSWLLKSNLDRSKGIIRENMKCVCCKINSGEWNFKSIHYLYTSCMFRSWTKSLLNLEKNFGNKFEKYLCDRCKHTTDLFNVSTTPEEYVSNIENIFLE
tara:strand:+ start:2811 stop:3281 length:471 start_codon:yes stop_codon:yes gene_type:complete